MSDTEKDPTPPRTDIGFISVLPESVLSSRGQVLRMWADDMQLAEKTILGLRQELSLSRRQIEELTRLREEQDQAHARQRADMEALHDELRARIEKLESMQAQPVKVDPPESKSPKSSKTKTPSKQKK